MTDAVRRPVTAQDLTRLRGVSDPQISPDGRRVAFVMTTASQERDEYLSNVWVVDVNGGEPRRLTTGPTKDTLPRWSPDGRWLAFASDRGTKKKPQLYAMPADGGEATQLTDLPNGVFGQGGVAWSPEGRAFAHAGMHIAEDGYNFLVYLQPADGSERICLTEALDRPAWDIVPTTWSANGEWVLFVGRDHGTYPLYRVRAKGGEPPVAIVGGHRTVSGFSVAQETGTIAFSATEPTKPAEVFVCNADGSGERQL